MGTPGRHHQVFIDNRRLLERAIRNQADRRTLNPSGLAHHLAPIVIRFVIDKLGLADERRQRGFILTGNGPVQWFSRALSRIRRADHARIRLVLRPGAGAAGNAFRQRKTPALPPFCSVRRSQPAPVRDAAADRL